MLTPDAITRTERGYYHDGNGLYLQVSKYGTKSWILRFSMGGRAREMGLGSLKRITLPEARVAAIEAQKLVLRGIDPIEARNGRREAKALHEYTDDEIRTEYRRRGL